MNFISTALVFLSSEIGRENEERGGGVEIERHAV